MYNDKKIIVAIVIRGKRSKWRLFLLQDLGNQSIDWVSLSEVYRATALSQPVCERPLIFTLPDYISHLRATVASFITDSKGLGGFPLFGMRPFTASYLPKPPG